MPAKDPRATDGRTGVYQRLHGCREVVSIRCKPEIKEALKSFCEANGLSICHVFEGLATAYLHGMQQKIHWVNQSPTINLTLVRDVRRVRRYAQSLDHDEAAVEDSGSFERCAFCDQRSTHQYFYWNGQPTRCSRLFVCSEHLGHAPAGYRGRRKL